MVNIYFKFVYIQVEIKILYSSPHVIRSLPPQATPPISPDFRCTESDTTKLSPSRVTTLLIKLLCYCIRGGPIKGGPLFYISLLVNYNTLFTRLRVQSLRVRVMVFNATFNNISFIFWWSVLLVEENGVPG